MIEIETEIILEQLPDVPRAIEGLAEHMGLSPESLGMTSTLDRLVDTEDMAILAKDHSLRVRQKLENVYQGNELRLTYKTPLRDHDRLMIRREQKVKFLQAEYDHVLDLLGQLAVGVSGHSLVTLLHIEELAREANLGPKGGRLNVSVDHCRYSLPGDERSAEEFVFELESHGIPEDMVLKAADWVLSEFGGREARQGKYPRGLRLMNVL